MAILNPGEPVTIQQAVLQVENELPPGRYRFQLVVTDDAGLESDPAELVVQVRPGIRPRDPVGPDVGEPVITGPRRPTVLRPELLRPGVVRPFRRPP